MVPYGELPCVLAEHIEDLELPLCTNSTLIGSSHATESHIQFYLTYCRSITSRGPPLQVIINLNIVRLRGALRILNGGSKVRASEK